MPARRTAAEVNRRYFHDAYRTGEHGWGVGDPSPYAAKFLGRLKELAPRGHLLDIGCGEGRHAIMAAGMGFQVTAVDYEPKALVRARRLAEEKGIKGISFRVADALSLEDPKVLYDVVLDYGCLHHQRKADWPAYKSSVLRVLSPGGFFVLSVFSPKFPLFGGGSRKWHIARGSYRRCFTKSDLVMLFGREFKTLEMIEENGGRHGFWHALFERR